MPLVRWSRLPGLLLRRMRNGASQGSSCDYAPDQEKYFVRHDAQPDADPHQHRDPRPINAPVTCPDSVHNFSSSERR
jgi:hypothetical protein